MWKPLSCKGLLNNVEARNEFRSFFFIYVHIGYCTAASR
jgi:hypothetical protein